MLLLKKYLATLRGDLHNLNCNTEKINLLRNFPRVHFDITFGLKFLTLNSV